MVVDGKVSRALGQMWVLKGIRNIFCLDTSKGHELVDEEMAVVSAGGLADK